MPEPAVDTAGRRTVAAAYRIAAVPVTVAVLPVMLVIALAVLITSGRPILYRQQRVGRQQRPFDILKFRTMVPDAESRRVHLSGSNEHDGVLFKIRDDPRVTRLGRWLRKYSLDELPQLFNVLNGDMVFVGPRPVLPEEAARFGPAEQRRFLTKPGMTGIWQVSGRSNIPWAEAVALDLYYVENWSPLLDLSILVKTIWVVLAGTGY